MYEKFIDKAFRSETMRLITWADGVCSDYLARGYSLSLRQLFYQGVKDNVYPNSQESYDRLKGAVADGRMAGLIDWDAIVDRGRVPHIVQTWDSPYHIMRSTVEGFKIDKWQDQTNYVVVACEKQALEGVLAPVCRKLEVPFHSNKGYSSATAMYDLGKELQERTVAGRKKCHVIYFGDFDPSGVHMSTDVADRLALFSQSDITVHRAALTMRQIERHNLIPNPTKMSDSRAPEYVAKYGNESWELDALDVELLATICRNGVLSLRDEDKWNDSCYKEEELRIKLDALAETLKPQ
jgi:hypothetical protein